jgi:hypothetical protein
MTAKDFLVVILIVRVSFANGARKDFSYSNTLASILLYYSSTRILINSEFNVDVLNNKQHTKQANDQLVVVFVPFTCSCTCTCTTL